MSEEPLIDKINEERCYNLPLNEFYKDKVV